jgi:hypothetical protein
MHRYKIDFSRAILLVFFSSKIKDQSQATILHASPGPVLIITFLALLDRFPLRPLQIHLGSLRA